MLTNERCYFSHRFFIRFYRFTGKQKAPDEIFIRGFLPGLKGFSECAPPFVQLRCEANKLLRNCVGVVCVWYLKNLIRRFSFSK